MKFADLVITIHHKTMLSAVLNEAERLGYRVIAPVSDCDVVKTVLMSGSGKCVQFTLLSAEECASHAPERKIIKRVRDIRNIVETLRGLESQDNQANLVVTDPDGYLIKAGVPTDLLYPLNVEVPRSGRTSANFAARYGSSGPIEPLLPCTVEDAQKFREIEAALFNTAPSLKSTDDLYDRPNHICTCVGASRGQRKRCVTTRAYGATTCHRAADYRVQQIAKRLLDKPQVPETIVWTRPKADNNIVNNFVRWSVLAASKVVSVVRNAFNFLRGGK